MNLAALDKRPLPRIKPTGRRARTNNFDAMAAIHRAITDSIEMREGIYQVISETRDRGLTERMIELLRQNDQVIESLNQAHQFMVENEMIFLSAAKRQPYSTEGNE